MRPVRRSDTARSCQCGLAEFGSGYLRSIPRLRLWGEGGRRPRVWSARMEGRPLEYRRRVPIGFGRARRGLGVTAMPTNIPKPRVFIGSSSEALDLVDALVLQLGNRDILSQPWHREAFAPSASTMSSILRELDRSDFGVFIFHQDDRVHFRGNEVTATRDNTVLEYGLFVGRLGPERTIGVLPRDPEHHAPTDTAGLEFATYDPADVQNVVADSVGLTAVATQIASHVRRIGPRIVEAEPSSEGGEQAATLRPSTRSLEAPPDGWSYLLDRGLLSPVPPGATVRMGQVLVHALHGAGRVVGMDPGAAGGSIELRMASGTGFYSLESEVLYFPPS